MLSNLIYTKLMAHACPYIALAQIWKFERLKNSPKLSWLSHHLHQRICFALRNVRMFATFRFFYKYTTHHSITLFCKIQWKGFIIFKLRWNSQENKCYLLVTINRSFISVLSNQIWSCVLARVLSKNPNNPGCRWPTWQQKQRFNPDVSECILPDP